MNTRLLQSKSVTRNTVKSVKLVKNERNSLLFKALVTSSYHTRREMNELQ